MDTPIKFAGSLSLPLSFYVEAIPKAYMCEHTKNHKQSQMDYHVKNTIAYLLACGG